MICPLVRRGSALCLHDSSVVVELTVITEYLEEAFPEHALLPATPVLRARTGMDRANR